MNIFQKALFKTNKKSIINEVPIVSGLPLLGNSLTASNVSVNTRTTLQHHAVYTCVRTLTSDIAKIPLRLEKKFKDGWVHDTNHKINKLLKEPNDRIVTFEFIEQIIFNILTCGASYVVVVRDKIGNPYKLFPMLGNTTSVIEDYNDGELYYKVTSNQLIPYQTSVPTEQGASRTIYHSDMIRVNNLSLDNGIYGWSIIELASEAFGLALATQEAAARAYANGAHTNGYFKETGSNRGNEQKAATKEALNRQIKGVGAAGSFAIVNGLDWVPMDSNIGELQLVEARREITLEIARMYRVPSYKLGLADSEKAANISEQEQSYISNTLIQYTRPLEQHLDRVLLADNEKDYYRFRFDFTKQAEPNEQIRAQYYQSAITYGWMNINEVRQREDMCSIPDGDTFRVPLNTGVLGDNNSTDLTGGEPDEDKTT